MDGIRDRSHVGTRRAAAAAEPVPLLLPLLFARRRAMLSERRTVSQVDSE